MGDRKRKVSFWKILLFTMAILFCGIAGAELTEVHAANVTAGFHKSGGNTYYIDNNGEYHKGWLYLGEDTYFFNTRTSVMATGWVKAAQSNMRYFGTDGKMAKGWTKIDGKTYYFIPKTGYMKLGWLTLDGKKYLLHTRTGAMFTKWYTNNLGQRRYFHATKGYMYSGWYTLGDNKRYFDTSTGILGSGRVQIDGKYYYFDTKTGFMKTGWVTDEVGDKYYFKPSTGEMVTGQVTINGVPHKFAGNGVYLGKVGTGSGDNQSEAVVQTKSIKNLFIQALKPIGSTLYLYGGGHDSDATRIGLNPNWAKAYKSGSYAYGLDCSGYVGWSIYQVMRQISTGWSGTMEDTYVSRGWGTKTHISNVSEFRAGDIGAHGDHIWMILGQCKDGSVVVLHSSGTAGPQIAGTATPSGNYNSQAATLAQTYMKRYSGYTKYKYDIWTDNWFNDSRTYIFRWNRSVLADPDGYSGMTADAIMKDLSAYIGD